VDAASGFKLILNALLPALIQSFNTPVVRDMILAMITRLLGQLQTQTAANAAGRFGAAMPYVPETQAEAHILAMPEEQWNPETIIRVVEEHAAS
jgi:hypothetical protein